MGVSEANDGTGDPVDRQPRLERALRYLDRLLAIVVSCSGKLVEIVRNWRSICQLIWPPEDYGWARQLRRAVLWLVSVFTAGIVLYARYRHMTS